MKLHTLLILSSFTGLNALVAADLPGDSAAIGQSRTTSYGSNGTSTYPTTYDGSVTTSGDHASGAAAPLGTIGGVTQPPVTADHSTPTGSRGNGTAAPAGADYTKTSPGAGSPAVRPVVTGAPADAAGTVVTPSGNGSAGGRARPPVRTVPDNAGFDSDGRARHAFMEQTGFPEGRPGYVIDYVRPLSQGGGKTPDNMKWVPIDEAGAR